MDLNFNSKLNCPSRQLENPLDTLDSNQVDNNRSYILHWAEENKKEGRTQYSSELSEQIVQVYISWQYNTDADTNQPVNKVL